jgi:glutaconate CoA-transferase, subunit B
MISESCSLEELLIARMAREFRGGGIGVGATILGDLAARLAKALHVPDLFLTTSSRAAADPDVRPKAIADEWSLDASARMALGWEEMFRLISQGRLEIWIGAVQLDAAGASNISVIGDWRRPKAQLIGARGLPDDLWGCKRLNYHIRNHSRKVFVEKVDFVCSAGVDAAASGGARPALPGVVATDLGMFDYGGENGRMRVVSLHPGVTLEEVRDRTGFALETPAAAFAVTEAPTTEELRLIREVIDPNGLRRLESDRATPQTMIDIWEAEIASQDGAGPR